ncbi:MAG: hypothetical protein ABII23_00580 [bacterium]
MVLARNLFVFSILVALISVYSLRTEENSLIKQDLLNVDVLFEDISVKNMETAIKILQPILEIDPDNYEACLKTTRAYIEILTIKTSALIIEKDEYKPLLKQLGRKADVYARKAYELNPENKEAVMTALQAHGYFSSSFGIAAAIIKVLQAGIKN